MYTLIKKKDHIDIVKHKSASEFKIHGKKRKKSPLNLLILH